MYSTNQVNNALTSTWPVSIKWGIVTDDNRTHWIHSQAVHAAYSDPICFIYQKLAEAAKLYEDIKTAHKQLMHYVSYVSSNCYSLLS